jgi:AraC-like DNA-binding protein
MSAGANNRWSQDARRRRIKANLLRRLTSAPLSQWPETLVECLDALKTLPAPAAPTSVALACPTENEAMLSPHVWRICEYISTHYGDRISLESLAARVGRNTGYTATSFRRQTGITIHRYLTGIRMQRAAKLLRRREKVEAVMLLVGYRSKKNFYRQFEATFGVTPGQYKASQSGPTSPSGALRA